MLHKASSTLGGFKGIKHIIGELPVSELPVSELPVGCEFESQQESRTFLEQETLPSLLSTGW